MQELRFRGSIPELIRNDLDLYEGNLEYYLALTFKRARNLYNPYHNFSHVYHVFFECHDACQFYGVPVLTPREMRDLLVAAIMHDWNHPGRQGRDDLNIRRSLSALKKYAHPQDRPRLKDISDLIRPTEYPYRIAAEKLGLSALILRDADVSQALDVTWVQQVPFGLGREWGMRALAVLRMQRQFLGGLKFHTQWAREKFPQAEIDGKIAEAEGYVEIIERNLLLVP